MTVLCAWCLKEGKPAFLRESEPRRDPSESHGICANHLMQVKAEVACYLAEAAVKRRRAKQ